MDQTNRFADLKEASQAGRADTRKNGPWLNSWDMRSQEWNAYCTGLHREAFPGSSNRGTRKGVRR